MTEARSVEDQDGGRTGIAGIVPLHEAVRNWDTQMVELLVKSRANVNKISPNGWTILDLALLVRNESIVKLLIQHQAQLSGQTSTAEAIVSPQLRETAQRLLENNGMFPPSDLQEAYTHVINHPESMKT